MQETHKKKYKDFSFYMAIGSILSLLVFFKYLFTYNIGVKTFTDNQLFPYEASQLLIPIGLSYYSLQAIAYLIDVHRNKIQPSTQFVDFSLFLMFFPQVAMGPIERRNHLETQFKVYRKVKLENLQEGFYLIALSLLKRLVIFNELYPVSYWSRLKNHSLPSDGLWLYVEIILGFFYIYLDFSSYMDLARGGAKLMGINISKNFHLPFLSRSPAEFWQRWHMTLVAWIRDYLYLPVLLKTKNLTVSIFVLFLMVGLFHGASWTWILWALYWTLVMVLYHQYRRHLLPYSQWLRSDHFFMVTIKRVMVFCMISFSIVFTWIDSPSEILGLVNRLHFSTGHSVLARFNSYELSIVLIGMLLVFAQEVLIKDLPMTLSASRMTKTIVTYVNLILAMSFGNFVTYPFQYLNF